MMPRAAVRFSPLLLALFIAGCDSELPGQPEDLRIQLDPLFFGVVEGDTLRIEASLGGEEAEVTWASTDEEVATVDAEGLVTGVSGGTAAVTATLASDPSTMRSASVTVIPVPELTSGVPITDISASGARGTGLYYKIDVPAGATALTVTLSGGTGDADIYVKGGSLPSDTDAECWSFNAGNEEECTVDDPTTGTYFIFLYLWDPFAETTLTATVTP